MQVRKYRMGAKTPEYLTGGQVKLDKNKDGKISGEDFKMMMAGGVMPKYNMGGQMQGSPEQAAPVNVGELLEMLSQMPSEAKLSPEEVARFIMGDLPMNVPQGPPMSQGGGMQ
jgi:hypothetical protein|tara:strand:- start:76 stop:414 length:339 start_codon:yes stop_codon:yes gene_type:complete